MNNSVSCEIDVPTVGISNTKAKHRLTAVARNEFEIFAVFDCRWDRGLWWVEYARKSEPEHPCTSVIQADTIDELENEMRAHFELLLRDMVFTPVDEEQKDTPEACTCPPGVTVRNPTGHAPDCPAYGGAWARLEGASKTE